MADIEMATGARDIAAAMDAEDGVGQFGVTALASALSDAVVIAFDLNVVRKTTYSERE